MRVLAYLMIALGFLGGSLVAVQKSASEVNWVLYGPALALGAVGVILARVARGRVSQQAERLNLDAHKLVASLDRIVQKIVLLDGEKEVLTPSEIHQRIDQAFRADLDAFVAARQSLIHLHGLPVYTSVMNRFAAGERYLNRVWSAAVDGYIDEVMSCLAVARVQFEEARHELHQARHAPGRTAPSAGPLPSSL